MFLFDYLHLATLPCPGDPRERTPCLYHARALAQLRDRLAASDLEGEEVMVAVLNGELRIELPFTTDRAAVLAALDRMEDDASLFAGHFAHMDEDPLFRGLFSLLELLQTGPGPTGVVLFTAGNGPGPAGRLTTERSVSDRAFDFRVTTTVSVSLANVAVTSTSAGSGLGPIS